MKRVMRLGNKENHSPRYIDSYVILRCIGDIAYELHLPLELVVVHLVFYVSMLKKCIGYPSLVVTIESIRVKDSFSYEVIPINILDHKV